MAFERWVVCGSREWPENFMWFVTAKMIELIPHGSLVITGGAPGVDRHANREAIRLHYKNQVFYPDWMRYGRGAGFIRNLDMIRQNPDGVIAFQYKKSRGTAHTIREAMARGLNLHVFTEEDLKPDIAALDGCDEDD